MVPGLWCTTKLEATAAVAEVISIPVIALVAYREWEIGVLFEHGHVAEICDPSDEAPSGNITSGA